MFGSLRHLVPKILKGVNPMRKLILVAVTLLCSGLWAFAQSSSSSSTSPADSSAGQMGSTSASSTTSGANTSIDGCLSGASGSYTLKDKASGTTYNLAGDTSKLASHVGEEVRISGSSEASTSASASSPSSSASSTPSSSGSSMSNGSGQSFNVHSVSKVSSTCSSGQ
jgi:hypothetical protein